MKIYFEVAAGDVATSYVTIENQDFLVSQIASLAKMIGKPITMTRKGALIGITINMPVYFQGAGVTGTPSSLYVLDNNNTVAMKNFANTTLSRFAGGKIYCIPYAIVPCVDIVPTENNILVQGVSTVFPATHWAYLSPTEMSLINQTSVSDVLQVDIDVTGAALNNASSEQKKQVQAAQVKQALIA